MLQIQILMTAFIAHLAVMLDNLLFKKLNKTPEITNKMKNNNKRATPPLFLKKTFLFINNAIK